MDIINIKKASMVFGNQYAFKDIDAVIKKGEFVVIAGPNGSGKTTLMKALLNLNDLTSGEIKVDLDSVGYLPQNTNIQDKNFPATVEEIIQTGIEGNNSLFSALSKEKIKEIKDLLGKLGVAHTLKKRIGILSGGQQQRVLLARALINKPEVLILDEPTSALDPETREFFYKLLDEYNRELATTIILVSHDIVSSCEYAKRIIYLDQEIVFDGPFDVFCEKKDISPYFHDHEPHHI